MEINEIIPIEKRSRLCVHCDDEHKTTYLIAEPRMGKTTECIRQAVFRRCHILSKEFGFFKSVGMKHASETKNDEIGYLTIYDLLYGEKNNFEGKTKLNLCIDGAKGILEDLLTEKFGIPIEIQYMSIEAPRKDV